MRDAEYFEETGVHSDSALVNAAEPIISVKLGKRGPDRDQSGHHSRFRPEWSRSAEAQREAHEHYAEMERQSRKHWEEAWREERKFREELERESFKHWREMEREARGTYVHRGWY